MSEEKEKELKELRKIIKIESRAYLEKLSKRKEEGKDNPAEGKGNYAGFLIARFLDLRLEMMEKTYLEPLKEDIAVLRELKWLIRTIAGSTLGAVTLYALRFFGTL